MRTTVTESTKGVRHFNPRLRLRRPKFRNELFTMVPDALMHPLALILNRGALIARLQFMMMNCVGNF